MYNVYMIRTQIYLPEEIHTQLKELAKTHKTTISELVRKGAKKVIRERKKKDESGKFMLELASFNFSGPKDLSKNHTEYYLESVFGKKK